MSLLISRRNDPAAHVVRRKASAFYDLIVRIGKPAYPFRAVVAIILKVGTSDWQEWLAMLAKLPYLIFTARCQEQGELSDDHVGDHVFWHLCACRRHKWGQGLGAL